MIGRMEGAEERQARQRREARLAMLRDTRAVPSAGPVAALDAGSAQAASRPIGSERPGKDGPTTDPWAEPWDQGPRTPLWRRAIKALGGLANVLILVVVIGGVGFATGGFLRYFDEVEGFVPPPVTAVAPADGIVVLTGGPRRLAAAGRLLEADRGAELLVSGVNLRVTEPQLRDLLGVDTAAFACCVELGFEARDTIGNARETAAWFARLTDEESGAVGRGAGRRLIVVTSNYHMRRALHELKRALPSVTLEPYPVHGVDLTVDDWWREAGTWRLLLGEYGKLMLAQARDYPAIARLLSGFFAPSPVEGAA